MHNQLFMGSLLVPSNLQSNPPPTISSQRVQNNSENMISTIGYSSDEMIDNSYELNIPVNILRIIFPFEKQNLSIVQQFMMQNRLFWPDLT